MGFGMLFILISHEPTTSERRLRKPEVGARDIDLAMCRTQ
jgi:hypothetical protein